MCKLYLQSDMPTLHPQQLHQQTYGLKGESLIKIRCRRYKVKNNGDSVDEYSTASIRMQLNTLRVYWNRVVVVVGGGEDVWI